MGKRKYVIGIGEMAERLGVRRWTVWRWYEAERTNTIPTGTATEQPKLPKPKIRNNRKYWREEQVAELEYFRDWVKSPLGYGFMREMEARTTGSDKQLNAYLKKLNPSIEDTREEMIKESKKEADKLLNKVLRQEILRQCMPDKPKKAKKTRKRRRRKKK